ncbi:MAG: aminoglycoside phosphotransferase family protein [bacterium]|nr:aminoglycoside phosphotransferase family protein [bacterium]
MIKESSLSEQRLIEGLKTYYGIEVSTLTFLPLGADMHASVYKAQVYNGPSYFVKVRCGGPQDLSATLIELLRHSGIQHINPIVKTLKGQATQRMGDVTLTVSPFIKGQDGFSRDLTKDQWRMLGKAMRKIHDIEVPPLIQDKIRREFYSSKWRDVVRALYPLLKSEPRGDVSAVNFLTLMKTHEVEVHRLVDRAEQLAQKAQEESPLFVLCHCDLHGGNILIDEKGSFYIVDWDDPILAPKERDLMFIGGGVGNVWNKPYEEELFYKGYGKAEVSRTLLAYYRHERIVEDLAVYGQSLLLTTKGGEDRATWYKQAQSQFEPQGVVEIAFKTDKNFIYTRHK